MVDALLLANPVCAERHGHTLESLRGLLEDAGLRTQAVWFEDHPDARALRQQIEAVRPNMVVAAGGDGTIHHVVNAIAPLGLTLGVLPLGTANDFARTLQLPTALDAAVQLLAEAAPIGVDLARVDGHYFLNAAHLGMGVEVARRTNPRLKRWLGPLAYGIAAFQAWREAEPLAIEVCLEGRQCMRLQASQLLVGNGRYFGGGMIIAEDATLDDGLLDLHILGPEVSAGEAIKLLAAARTGHLADQADLLYARASRFTARLSRPTDVNVDGEIVRLSKELTFEVLPRALQVIAPAVESVPIRAAGELAAGLD